MTNESTINYEGAGNPHAVQNNTCSCANRVVNAELQGSKLEMTSLESWLLSVTSKSDNESEIKSLRVKLKDLEAVI
jgi:hypothetical protein